jgi:two-component system, sensor histidine kinase PdtaS
MMVGEVSAPEARVTPRLTGEFGLLPALVATPLALVLTELLQNALQHGLSHPGQGTAGALEVVAVRGQGRLTVTVSDDGAGLPADFDLDSTSSLGLQIVRTLVLTELNGRLEIAPRQDGGTRVLVELPLGEVPLAEVQPGDPSAAAG